MSQPVDYSPEANKAIMQMLPQLLIVLVNRLGGTLDIPISEIDQTGGDLLAFNVDPEKKVFHFEIRKKA